MSKASKFMTGWKLHYARHYSYFICPISQHGIAEFIEAKPGDSVECHWHPGTQAPAYQCHLWEWTVNVHTNEQRSFFTDVFSIEQDEAIEKFKKPVSALEDIKEKK